MGRCLGGGGGRIEGEPPRRAHRAEGTRTPRTAPGSTGAPGEALHINRESLRGATALRVPPPHAPIPVPPLPRSPRTAAPRIAAPGGAAASPPPLPPHPHTCSAAPAVSPPRRQPFEDGAQEALGGRGRGGGAAAAAARGGRRRRLRAERGAVPPRGQLRRGQRRRGSRRRRRRGGDLGGTQLQPPPFAPRRPRGLLRGGRAVAARCGQRCGQVRAGLLQQLLQRLHGRGAPRGAMGGAGRRGAARGGGSARARAPERRGGPGAAAPPRPARHLPAPGPGRSVAVTRGPPRPQRRAAPLSAVRPRRAHAARIPRRPPPPPIPAWEKPVGTGGAEGGLPLRLCSRFASIPRCLATPGRGGGIGGRRQNAAVSPRVPSTRGSALRSLRTLGAQREGRDGKLRHGSGGAPGTRPKCALPHLQRGDGDSAGAEPSAQFVRSYFSQRARSRRGSARPTMPPFAAVGWEGVRGGGGTATTLRSATHSGTESPPGTAKAARTGTEQPRSRGAGSPRGARRGTPGTAPCSTAPGRAGCAGGCAVPTKLCASKAARGRAAQTPQRTERCQPTSQHRIPAVGCPRLQPEELHGVRRRWKSSRADRAEAQPPAVLPQPREQLSNLKGIEDENEARRCVGAALRHGGHTDPKYPKETNQLY